MKNNYQITPIIATFNRWDLVKVLVKELAESFHNKAIIINDGGDAIPEDDLNYFKKYADIINLDTNIGQSKATFKGAEQVKTSHMLIIDSDDLIETKSLDRILSKLNDTDIFLPKDIFHRNKIRERKLNHSLTVKDLRKNSIGANSGIIIPTKVFQRHGIYRFNLTSCIDWEMYIRFYKSGIKFKTYPGMIKYNIETEGISRNLQKVYLGRCELWKLHPDIFSALHRPFDLLRLLKYSSANCAIKKTEYISLSFQFFRFFHSIGRCIFLLVYKSFKK